MILADSLKGRLPIRLFYLAFLKKMKPTTYQNVLLTIIAASLIVITLYVSGIIEYKGYNIPVSINNVGKQKTHGSLPVRIQE